MMFDRYKYYFLAVLAVIVFVGLNSLYVVAQPEQAIVLQFGEPIRLVKEPGLKVKMPFIQNVVIYDTRLLNLDPPKQVVDAFNEVQRAKADMERFKNEAEAYRNEILPKAQGEAAQRLQNAQAYKEAVVNKAKGEAERFISVYNAYKQGKDVTAKRLYLETMEEVLNKSNKVILDQSGKGNAILPLLPINQNSVASTAVNNKN